MRRNTAANGFTGIDAESDRTLGGFAVFAGLAVAAVGAGLGWGAMALLGVAVVVGAVLAAHVAARDRTKTPPEVSEPDPVVSTTPAD